MIKDIDIGREIEAQLNRLNINKSEFSRRVGMPSQNVNRLLESRNIYTDKLVRVSEALDYNFFRLWVDDEPTTIDAERSAVAVGDNNTVIINDTSALLALIQMYHADIMRLIRLIEKGKGAQ